MSGIINTAIKTTLLPASGEDKGIKKNVSVVLDTCVMDSNSSAFNFRNFFSNPTEAKWPDIPFTPTNVLSISEFSSEPLSKVDLELTSEPPKKSESKPDLVARRKSKMKNLHMLDDEKMLDTDLADLVKSMETDKKLDSDSSADAIFDDDINNNKTNYGSMKNFQFCGKSNILSKNKNSTAYYRKNLPESNSYMNTPKNSALVNSCIDSKYSHPYATPPSISLLKEARSSSAVPTTCNIPNNNILPISTVPANPIFKSETAKVKKLQQGCFIYDSQMPPPNVSQSNIGESTPFSNQSIYASMGLDEDLCDIKTSKTVEKFDSYHASNKQEVTGSNNKTGSLCQEFANVPIKIENITPPASPGKVENKIHSNSSISINDMHVSMTFETDPYDDELDDMPLSFLKDRVADKNSSEAEKDNKNVIAASSNNSVGIPIFIKKESIQNEIAWEGPEIFSQNISSEHSKDNINLASSSNLPGLISMEGDRDLPASLVPVAVKIKTEPNTEFEFSKSTFKMSCSESLHQVSIETDTKRKTKNVQINITNKIVLNESDSINYTLPIVNSVRENLSKLCDTNSDIYNKPSAIVEAESNNCVISASAKDYLHSDASLSHSNMEQAKSFIIPQTSLGSCFSAIQTNIQKQVEKQYESNFGTNNEKSSNTSEQLSNIPQINKTDLVGDSDISTESISPKYKSRKRKSTKFFAEGVRKNLPAAGEICDEFSAESTEYKEKCNMDEITKECVNVDENLPITLLIKRKKTNLYDSHTFHYTSISKSEISERTLLNENVGSKIQSSILNYNPEENLSEKVDSSLSNFENSSPKKISVRKKKRTPKKSLVKKRGGKNTPNNIDKNEIFNNPNDNLAGNLETNVVSTNESKSSSNFSKEGDSASSERKNTDTFVYMSFEEQNSPIDEASEEYFQSVLSFAKRNSLLYSDNIDKMNTSIMKKIENENILLPEVQSKNLEQSKSMITEEQCSSAVLEISSDLISVTTNVNSQQLPNDEAIPKLTDNNSISRKKKKRPRTFGWSKKKKQKSKITLTNLSTNVITSSVSINEVVPVPEKVDVPTQTPVVMIKNLVPDGEKAVSSNEQKIHKDFLEKQDIIIPIVKEGKKIVCKRKKTAKSKQSKKFVKSSISENAKVENSKNSNSETSTILKENVSVNLSPENDNMTTVFSSVCKESEIDIDISKTLLNKDKNSEVMNVSNSSIKPFCSSITQKNSNESYLKATDKFIQDEENSNNSIKSPSQNNLPKNFEDVMVADKNSGFTGNILCTSKASHFPDLKSASSNIGNESVQPISIKEEIGDDYQIVKSMNQLKSLNTVFDMFDISSSVDNFRSNETQVVNNSSCAKNLTSIKHEVPADNIHKEFRRVDSCPNLEYNSLCTNHSISSNNMNISVHQSSEGNNIAAVTDNFQHADQLALSIKKEIYDKTKAGLYQFSSLNVIRSQNDLIEKIASIHSNSPSNVLHTLSNATKDFSSEKQNIEPETSATAIQESNAGNVTDDEIQVLEIDTDDSKNVPCVDLTDDNMVVLIPNKQENKVNAKKISSSLPLQLNGCNNNEIHNENSKGSILTLTDISIKESAVLNQNNKRLMRMRHNSISPLVSERDSISPLLNNKIYSLPQGFAYLFPSDNRRTNDPFIFRQKYRHEYLKYPFPSSVLSHGSNQRNKHKVYTRINSQSLNLSIEKVESRLKNSDKVKTQFGNKLGDIVKLKKYPVSTSEVECYHRILGVAPSHKLLSKCFKPSDKTTNTILKDDFSEFQTPVCAYKERSNQQNNLNSSLNNIPGISNIKITKTNNSDFHTINEIYDRDCPSTNTVDSCDSYISNLSDIFVRAVEKKEVNNGNILKENEQFGIYTDAGASGRNLVLSCAKSDFEESHKTNLENANFNTKKFIEGLCTKNSDLKTSCSQNILSCLSLPSKEMLDSIVNNGESNRLLSNAETLNTNSIKILPVSENDFLLHNEPHLSYDSNTPAMSVTSLISGTELNTDIKSNALQNPNNSLLANDVLPVTELRKILEVVRSVSSDENNSESNSWKNKATFEYNHIRSAPMEQTSSNLNDLENVDVLNSSDTPFTSTPVECKTSNVTTEDHSFDDDDANDVPLNYESDFDKNETSDSKNEDKEKPKIPQYKSRWEKIMERKSHENKEIEQNNEHLLKDCFSVSAKLSSKKCNVSDETRVKTNNKKAKKSKKKESSKKFDMKPLNSKKKSSERKSKKNEWKSKASVTDYSKSKDIKKVSTKLTVKKHNGKNTHIDDVSNLFTPDKPAKSSKEKKRNTLKSNGTNTAKCFYGNRVTNRGTFLTNISTSEILKKIKIPKKKIPEAPKKLANVRSEEFHSMVKSPDINIDTQFVSSYKVRNKSNSYNKNKREEFNNRSLNMYSSKSTYFPKNDRRLSYAETHFSGFHHSSFEENMQSKKIPLLATPPLLPQHLNDESILNRKAYMLHTSEPFQSNNQSVPLRVNYRNSHLSSTSSTSFHQRNESFLNSYIPILGTQPCNSFEFSSVNSFQTDQTPPTAILRSIISSAQLNNSSASLKDNIRPFSDCLNPLWNKPQLSLSSHTFKEQPTFSDQSDTMSDSFPTGASCVSDGPSISEHLVSQLSFQNFDAAFKAKSLHTFNSSPISDEVPKKAICLVPQHLKSLVGNETIDTSNVRLLMLEWSVDWLMQQQKNQDPPPISNGLKKVVSSYDSFEDYYNTYFPLMLLDTWHRIFVSWTHLNQSSPYFCEITSYSVKSTFVSVECQTVFNKTAHPKGVFPDEGSILMVKYGYKCKNYSIKILGYVTNVKTRHFNPVTDSKLSNYKQPKDGNYDVLQVLTLTFMGAYNSEDIDKRLPIRIHVLCNVKSTLKQNDALLYINKSPLRAIILNPVEDGLLSVPLTPRNSPQDKVNECVREITKGIVSTHPLPLLTIVRAMPESDRLNIIPLLIKNMKSTYRTKVLLCVRTIKTLGDIAANICLHESLKLVIINKRCDTNVQFQRYLLDELVTSEMNKIGDQSIMDRPYLRNEAVIRTKKQIFSDCDVILSLIRNCHDEFMETTFTETESVAQMCCIVDEANLCTEPETLIPILHGVSKLILIGDPEYTAKVLSETAKEYDYHRSFFHRAYDLDLITE